MLPTNWSIVRELYVDKKILFEMFIVCMNCFVGWFAVLIRVGGGRGGGVGG